MLEPLRCNRDLFLAALGTSSKIQQFFIPSIILRINQPNLQECYATLFSDFHEIPNVRKMNLKRPTNTCLIRIFT